MRIFLTTALLFSVCTLQAQHRAPAGEGDYKPAHAECVTDAQREAIQLRIENNRKMLAAQGRDVSVTAAKPTAVALTWPIQQTTSTYFNCVGISNYVDHDVAYPGFIQDWNCGTRSYDLASGYNHSGTDIFLWPFYWNQMDDGNASIVAAAAGIIIDKEDGNFDRNCAMGSGNWNAVYVQHSDGSVAWYGHMKTGSLTTKAIGDAVTAGEYLGLVGSSGSSTGPHLHFELHDAADNVIDPYTGPCNPGATWWSPAHTYNESQVNALMTHSAPVVFSSCPNPDIINACDTFHYGDPIYIYAYYRDELSGLVSTFTITRPDGTISDSWTYTSLTDYVASYRYWSNTIPAGVPYGEWKISVTYLGNTYVHKYYILGPTDEQDSHLGTVSTTSFYPNPVTDRLYLQDVPKGAQVQLLNAVGAVVSDCGVDAASVNVANLATGMYFLKIVHAGGTEMQKVWKQ